MSNIKYWKNLKNELIEERPELKLEFDVINLKINLIKKVKEYMKNNSLTQKELADKLGVKQQTISRFLKGEINPRFDFIAKIMSVVNIKFNINNENMIFKENIKNNVSLRKSFYAKNNISITFYK